MAWCNLRLFHTFPTAITSLILIEEKPATVMSQTFISAFGKVIIENEKLYIRNVKSSFSYSDFFHIAWHLFIPIRFVMYLFEDVSPKRNVGVLLFGFMSIPSLFTLGSLLYRALFKESFAKRILLKQIVSLKTEEDPNELEVHLYLKLSSGKERKITFRKLEGQHLALSEALSPYLAHPNFA
jgi:hypothetical protein